MEKQVVLLLLAVILSVRHGDCQQCQYEFLTEPGTDPNSPLACNVLDATVVLRCKISDQGYTIGWHYSRERDGVATAEQIMVDQRYSISTNAFVTPRSLESVLTIQRYDETYDGFYFCALASFSGSTLPLSTNPSTVVEIRSEFSLQELQACEVEITLLAPGQRCAGGNAQEDVTFRIVPAAEFTNITIIPVTSTAAFFTTMMPAPTSTIAELPTTMLTGDNGGGGNGGGGNGGGGSGGDNTARTAIIWFSVGAVAFVLVTFGVVLGVIAFVKC